MPKRRELFRVEPKIYAENQGSLPKKCFFKMHRQRNILPTMRATHITRSVMLKEFFINYRAAPFPRSPQFVGAQLFSRLAGDTGSAQWDRIAGRDRNPE